MIIFDENFIDDLELVDLTESSEETYLPAENILDPLWSKSWQTTAGTSHTLIMDFGSAKGFTSACILLEATTVISSIVIEFNSSDSWGSPAATETLASSALTKQISVLKFASTQTYQYARLVVTLASSGVANVYRIHLGTSFTPYNPQTLGYKVGYIDQSRQSVNGNGARFTDNKTGIFRVRFDTSHVNEVERENWLDLAQIYGLKKHVFIAFEEDVYPETQSLYGKFTKNAENALVASRWNTHWDQKGLVFEGVREIE
jgi:hypothetical protein